MADLEDLRRR